MAETLPTVQRVVMGFLRDLLRPQDRAFIETFSDQPDLLAAFTADFETLENALLALYADRATALYDSVIMGLFQFSGVRGRKAMVVLTDGEDTASKNELRRRGRVTPSGRASPSTPSASTCRSPRWWRASS